MPTVREYEQALQRDPANTEVFLALRKSYRESGKLDKLVTLYEARGQAIEDKAKAAELFYLAAEVRFDHLNDAAGAEVDLAHAVDKDPGHLKATKRLKDIYRGQGRTAEYMTMLELEAAAVARTKEPARIAELQTEMGQLQSQHFARIERVIGSPARQGEVTAEMLKQIEQARKIYRALGDFQNVVRLFELELAGTTDGKRRADLLLGLGRVLGEKLGDLEGAAQKLGEVVRLRPRDDRALEALAAVYANPKWIGADGPERAASLYHQVARRRHEAGDLDSAVAALRKSLGAVPGHTEASDLLERVLYGAAKLPDLDRYYRERVAGARSVEERMDFLFKRAQLAEGDLGDRAEALRIYEEIVAIEPPGGPASLHLAQLYVASQDYGKLAELREKQLEVTTDAAFRLSLLKELAALYRDRLGDREQAAVYLHAILQIDPADAEALQAYGDHFRQRGDWKELADLLEFACEHARGQGAPAADLLPRLEEIAVIAEGKLGDADRALAAWQRIEELAPGYERAREAQKRILQKAKQWDRMVGVLEREAAGAAEPAQRIDVLRRLARIYVEKLTAPEKAAEVYQQILALDGRDVVALRALLEAYERGERWGELAKLVREQLEAAASKQEKLNLLRRLLVLYEERLGDLAEGSWAATEILKLAPGDRDALGRLERILERSDDKARLVQTLEYHTRYAATTEEKAQIIHRLADLLQNHLGEVERATGYWEQLVRIAPSDRSALDALVVAYEQLQKPEDLARVLELQVHRAGDDGARQAEFLRRLARVAAAGLKQPARAQRAWEEMLRLLPTDPEALQALSDAYATKGDWKALVAILERRVPLADTPEAAVAIALERARVLEEELRNADEAIRALEQIIAELDPRHVEAHDRLRRVAEAKGDWARVVTVAERQLFLTEDAQVRAGRAMEIGVLWRDRLGDPRNAIGAFERVIELDPENVQALLALAPLYAAAGDGQRLIFTNERLLARTEDPVERRRLLFEVAVTCEKQLRDARLAFEWYRRAYQERPDDEALGKLETVAEAHGLWEDLIQVYAGEKARSADPKEQVEVALKVASLCESRLGSPARAFVVLRDALPSDPGGEALLPELERLAAETGDWGGLLDVYARVARGRPSVDERVELLRLRAVVREDRLRDASGALDELLRSFALQPENAQTQNEILRLAEATGRWEDALGIQGQLFARAATVEEKVEVARRAAALVEEKVKDRVRAFRAYLNAFRLAPEDEGIVANLWRLAEAIGSYQAAAPKPAAGEGEGEGEGPAGDAMSADEAGATVEAAGASSGTAAAGEGEPDAGAAAGADAAAEDEAEEEEIEEIEEVEALEEAPPPPLASLRPGTPSPRAFQTPWEELAQAYELLPANDNATRKIYLRRIAEIWERGARDLDRAFQALERAFRLDVEDEEVRGVLRRLGEGEGRWDDVCEIYLRAVDAAPREQAVALQHEVARFREDLGQSAAAEERYLAILMLKPEDTAALDRLEHLYRSQERWSELAGILEKRTSGTTEMLPPGTERRQKSLELAELYEKRLERPYEAIDTLERTLAVVDEDERGFDHPEVVRESCDAYEALARLYSRVGMWPKAVGALQRELELVSDQQTLRQIRWRMAEIQERELGQPEHAVEAYQAILVGLPDDEEALAALDRLHHGHGRWSELDEILRRRAEVATGAERVEVIRRRARLLEEKLGNPDAAAAALRSLGAEVLEDEDATAALLRNLRSAGLAHEALRVLSQRIEMLGKQKAATPRLAALHLEVAALKSQQLGDAAGARQAIEAALAQTPEDPEALDALARLELKQSDFRAYARARLRQAGVLAGRPEAAAALLEAGAVFRDQLADPAEARRCFEKAVDESPASAEALHALGALLAADGQPAEARKLFERQLEVAEAASAKAAILTDIARTLWEKPGDAAEAIPRLDQALEIDPDYLPAVVTMADIYYKEQQWTEAERKLAQAVRRTRGQPEQAARLYHRLAEVYEKLGRLDEGYKQLGEADRMAPGQLLIKVALGENRYQARRWREALAHLEGIAEHPDAGRYPEEVAQAFACAAQCELKLKRPERAVELYQAGLRLAPEHGPSLRALADLALERGERAEAARYLRRVAGGSGDRAERARLFEQIGDLEQALGSADEARQAYESAIAMLDEPGEEQVGLLEKAFKLQRAAGAAKQAIETAERIVELVADPKDRAARRRDVAGLRMEHGDFARAAELLEDALAESPGDEEVLASLCDALERSSRGDELEALLGRALPELPPAAEDPAARGRRAALWERLGTLRGERDEAGAIAALERAVEVEPGRESARVVLAGLYGDGPEHAEPALQNHRALVGLKITRATSLRALANRAALDGRLDGARCCFEVLQLLGLSKKADRAFLDSHPAPLLKPEDPYSGAVDEADRARYLAHPEARVMAEVFAVLWEGVPGLVSRTVESYGVSPQDKVSPISEQDIARIYGQTGKALGNKKTGLYVNWDPGFDDVAMAMTTPPAIIVGQRIAGGAEAAEIRFRLGRALELTRPEYILAAAMPPRDFTQLFSSVLKAFHPRHARWRAGTQDGANEQAAKLKKTLPYKMAKRLAELFQANDATPFSSARWRSVVLETGNRAGLLMSGDLGVAARIVLREQVKDLPLEIPAETLREHAERPGALRELLRYAVSDEYFALRASVGTAVSKAAAA